MAMRLHVPYNHHRARGTVNRVIPLPGVEQFPPVVRSLLIEIYRGYGKMAEEYIYRLFHQRGKVDGRPELCCQQCGEFKVTRLLFRSHNLSVLHNA